MTDAPASVYEWQARPLLEADLRHALFSRNLKKSVDAYQIIDDMESELGWEATRVVQLTYATERFRSGTRSLRFAFEQRNEDYIRDARAENGSFTGAGVIFDVEPFAAVARLQFGEPQDWSEFNRLSFWCYVHPTGNPVNALALQFTSAGAPAGPTDPIAINYFADMRQGEWNFLTWEIPEMERDNVVDLSFFHPTYGLNFAAAGNVISFDIDDLRVERVSAEPVEGWTIAPGKVAFSHTGYAAGGEKIAVGGGTATEFRLVDDDTGGVVAEFPATSVVTRRGSFTEMNFSSYTRPGRYRIEAGGMGTEAFTIGNDRIEMVEATLNGIYAMRCGFAIPNVHDACHCDHLVSYGGESRIQAGGWHDAANLSQDPNNTSITVCALLDLAEALAPHHPDVADRALEEARWGLEWIMRMRFGAGIRFLQGEQSYYTDSVIGTIDDIVDVRVGSDTFKNLSAALAEVRGSRALRAHDTELAAALLCAAEEDFETVLRDRSAAPEELDEVDPTVVSWQNEIGYMTLVATELSRLSSSGARYADEAVRLARLLSETQEMSFIEDAPVTGYFYEDSARSRIAHEGQRTSGAPHSFEDGGPLAYQALCEAFPQHEDWMTWYAGLLAYSEFFCRKGSEASAPFAIIPAAVWRQSDVDGPISPDENAEALSRHANPLFPSRPTPGLIRAQMLEQYEAGSYLSEKHRLRTFPLYTDRVRHGSTAIHLTKSIGLGAGARVRNQPALSNLLARQVEWLTGANPFSRSLVYGVGYDWWQNFTVSLPNFVGGLAVGVNSYRGDAPAWGNNAVFPYKEVWIVPMARLAAVLARLPGRARISGTATVDAEIRHRRTGAITRVPSGDFDILVPPGEYDAIFEATMRRFSIADGAHRTADFDPVAFMDVVLEQGTNVGGAPIVRLTATGTGAHSLEIRTSNLVLAGDMQTIDLRTGTAVIELPLVLEDRRRFWVLVVVPDGDVRRAAEIFGTAAPLPDLSVDRQW